MVITVSLLVALFFVFLFAGGKEAFTSTTELRFDAERKPGLISNIIHRILRNLRLFTAAMTVGRTIFLIVSVLLMIILTEGYLNCRMLEDNSWVLLLLQLFTYSFLMLLLSDFLAKNLFCIYSRTFSRFFAIPLYSGYLIFSPIVKNFLLLFIIFLRIVGIKVRKDELVGYMGQPCVNGNTIMQPEKVNANFEGEFETEMKIFQNALDFSTIKIRDCMVHRTEIVAVDIETSLEDLKNLFVESGLSKIIVFKGNIDNVIGYIHSSEMFRATQNWKENVKEVPIVPETMGAHKLMKLFMQQKKTIAVVVDEFGGTSGIVSLEDLVEEIFGDIEDEHDNSSYVCKQVDEHEYLISARLEIEKVNETLDLDLPESVDYVTIGGMILFHYQSFPKLNEEIIIDKYMFKIIKKKATKIELVHLKILE